MVRVPVDPLNTGDHQYAWTDGTNSYYCLYVKAEAQTNTWLCASHRGVTSKTGTGYIPSNTDCCGWDATQ